MSKKRPSGGRKSPFTEPDSVTNSTILQTPPSFWEPTSVDVYKQSDEICLINYPVPDDNRPYVAIKVYGLPIRALLDSGSNYTVISEKVFAQLKPKKLHRPPSNISLQSASGDQLTILGQTYLPIRFHDRIKIVPTLVIQNLTLDCICGMDFWNKFQIQPTVLESVVNTGNMACIDPSMPGTILSVEERRRIEDIKQLFLPAKPGTLTITPLIQHRIVVGEEWKDKPPVRQFPYVMSPKTQELVAGELQRLLDVGIIERSSSD